MIENPELKLALDFVEKTDRNIFLTGKAGTGKTTFLHQIKHESLKRMVIVAPTGVAAINAKGVTIHSFFQMPFGPILPDTISNQSNAQRKFNRTKIDIIKSLDLVVIDEISMVRADLLDGIDQVLRRYKDRTKVFGGVQILMIGDLQQLSPVVKPNEWQLLQAHYQSVYFFSSLAFQQANAISIELKHIYRQDNQEFIKILNEIRNDKLSPASAETLNKRYNPDFSPQKNEGYITLTTHNNRADAINNVEIDKLKDKKYAYTADIKGKFNEYTYPTADRLTLKKGAQVMFIKNDSSPEKRYYNGKIGTITYLDNEEVIVQCPDDDFEITTTKETWENISYSLNDETKEIKEDVAGSFAQIPLRLAWAITIHKSQGLTFEKAIIDAEASFAHGQTYVALSRCKTLEGIVLKTPIKDSSIITDTTIHSFTKNVSENTPATEDLDKSQRIYQLNLIADLFNYHPLLYPAKRLIDIYYTNKTSFRGTIIEPLETIKDKGIIPLLKVANGFKNQMISLSEECNQLEDNATIQERFTKAVSYFVEQTTTHIKKPLEELTFTTDNQAVKKDFEKQLKNLDKLLTDKLYCLNGLTDGFGANKYLKTRAKAVLQTPTKKIKRQENTTSKHPLLVEKLRLLRDVFARSEDVPHFQVFTQKSLYDMSDNLPLTNKQLLAVNGMGKKRVQKYGEAILKIIQVYCDTNKIQPQEAASVAMQLDIEKKDTKHTSLDFFKEGLSIDEVAEKRGLVASTVESHLASFIVTGEIDILELIPQERFDLLKKDIEQTKFEALSDLKGKLDKSYSYSELRMMLIVLGK